MRIALWNTAFLGDAVLTLPFVHALYAALPYARIDWYVRKGVGALFSAQPELATVYEIGPAERSAAGTIRLMRDVAVRRYAVWISAHQSIRSSLIARASGAPVRIGYTGAWHRWLAYTHQVPRCFGALDEVERLLELTRPLPHACPDVASDAYPPCPHTGARAWPPVWPPAWPSVWPNLTLPDHIRAEAAAFRAALPPGPLLGIHPGSVWATKRWIPEGFASVARQAVDAGAVVALFGGPDETDAVSRVLELSGLDAHPRICNLAGRLPLPQLAAHLAVLDCYLTNDSGPMHIAWMQRTPVVALFGPTVRELGFFPRGEHSTVIEPLAHDPVTGAHFPPLDCRPCGLHGPNVCPRGDHACMRTISPERVWQAVRARLDMRPNDRPNSGPNMRPATQ